MIESAVPVLPRGDQRSRFHAARGNRIGALAYKGNGMVYVQYGCGRSSPDGWLNFDVSPTLRLQRIPLVERLLGRQRIFPKSIRYGDIVKGLPIADNSADGIFASHVLEHLSYAEFWQALRNTLRMLKPGGVFRLVVPDLEVRARRYLEQLEAGEDNANSWFMRAAGLGLDKRSRGIEALARSVLGNSAHLWMWDERSLSAALDKVGFVDIRRCRFNDSEDKAFLAVEEMDRFYDQSLSLDECAMEARKGNG